MVHHHGGSEGKEKFGQLMEMENGHRLGRAGLGSKGNFGLVG